MSRNNHNNQNHIRAGRIEGDPTCGLCYRACIEVNQVFDACTTKVAGQNFQLLLHDFSQDNLLFPYTFISARNYGDAQIANQVITPRRDSRCEGRNEKMCFAYDLIVPMIVEITDARGVHATAKSELTLHKDVELRVPRNTIVPYRLTSPVSVVCSSGAFITPQILSVSTCSVVISKIIVTTDIVVPSYGHAVFPSCRSCHGDVCEELLNRPLFPEF
ncbi:MAG: hypothetical protein FWC02_03310 [Firmicutes bacterium]|nr:hypothetical protein [Bacillota bacterium]